MNHLTWGVDGYGRIHVCEYKSGKHLLCVLPGCSVWDCIDDLTIDIESNKE